MRLKTEFYKIIKKKSFIVLSFVLIISSIVLFEFDLRLSDNQKLSHQQIYEEVEEATRSLGLDETENQINTFITINEAVEAMYPEAYFVENYEEVDIQNYEILSETYDKNDFVNAKKAMLQIQMRNRLKNYDQYHHEVLEELNDLIEDARLQNNTKKLSMYEVQEKIYQNLSSLEINDPDTLSVDALISSKYRSLVPVLFLLILVYTLSLEDEESGMSDVLALSYFGKEKIFFNKMIVLVSLLSIFVFCTDFIFNLYAMFRFGGIHWTYSIQSFESLMSSPYPFTVFDMQVILLGYRILYLSFLGLLLYSILSAFKNKQAALSIFLLFYFLSMLLYYRKPSIILNIYGLGQGLESIQSFKIHLLFTTFLSDLTLKIIGMVILILLLLWFNFVYQSKNVEAIVLPTFKIFRSKKSFETRSLLKHEMIKVNVLEGALFLWIVLILILGTLFISDVKKPLSPYKESIYHYLEDYGGTKDEKMIRHFENEKERYEHLEKDHQKKLSKYNSGNLSEEDYQAHLSDYVEKNKDIFVFNTVYKQFEDAQDYLINKNFYDELFSQYNYKREHIYSFVTLCFLILILSNLFGLDTRESEFVIYDQSYFGRSGREWAKFKTVLILVSSTFIITNLLYFISLRIKYPHETLNLLMRDIVDMDLNSVGFKKFPQLLNLKVSTYYLYILALRFLGILFVSLSIFNLSRLCKKRSTVLILSSFIFLIPNLLFALGFKSLRYLSTHDLFSGNLFFRSGMMKGKVIVILVVVFLLLFNEVYLYLKRK